MVDFINIKINNRKIIYNSKIRKTKKGTGIVRFKQMPKTEYVHVIFPILHKRTSDSIIIAIDEILNRKITEDDETGEISIQLGREYVGRKCIIIPQGINIEIDRKHIIYNREVKETYNGQGIVLLRDGFLGNRSYVIFPKSVKENEEDMSKITVGVDEILNKGIHPNNDHTSRVLLGQAYVGRKCILILQEG